MSQFPKRKKVVLVIGKSLFFIFNLVILVIIACYSATIQTYALPYAGVQVDGYQELEEPFYPFQQYIQVRKTYTTEHVPLYDQNPSTNLETSASNGNSQNSNGDHHAASTSHGGDENQNQYHVPRLREEVHDYKKHEVYEEKGYGDSDYDHKSYGHSEKHHEPSYNDHHQGASSNVQGTSASGRRNKYHTRRPSLHTPDGSSTKILEYVAANLHDKDAQQKGIYAARDDIYCPEVIDFDLSSKSMRMGQGWRGGAKPRLQGLGSKIKCLKEKYFGREPLPKAIFDDPSESRHSVIEIPTFQNFFSMVRQDVDSSSSFQNAKVPI